MSPDHGNVPAAAGRAASLAHQAADSTAGAETGPDRLSEGARKHFATLQARAALHGITLLHTTDDCGQPLYVVSRWALTRAFDNLLAVSQWLDRVTGATS